MNRIWYSGVFLFLCICPQAYAQGYETEQCERYSSIVRSPAGPEVVVPDSLLKDEDLAAFCLTRELKFLAAGWDTPEFDRNTRVRMNRASAALRRLIEQPEKVSRTSIHKIRSEDSPEMIHLLALGARSSDRTTRLNSTRLLGNIIDNDQVCVVMAQFADPDFNNVGSPVNGRINLAAVVAVVAPWAYRENYSNINRLHKYLKPIAERDKDANTFKSVLNKMKSRLDFQDQINPPNKDTSLEEAELKNCLKYKPRWAKGTASFKLNYTNGG